jgi:uncharacterized protein YjbI with pentapeptide repeats
MTITYDDIKHKLQPPLDCSKLEDIRGEYFYNCLILNHEDTDFSGCVLYHCFPSGFANALEINPAQSQSDVSLQGANLEGADLVAANLQKANLQEADLVAANLYGANLMGADLEKANLQEANLMGADLQEADLVAANLEEANLEEADLWSVNLQGANLEGANLRGADLQEANLQGANLQGAYLQYAKLREALYNSKTKFEFSNITPEQKDSMIFIEDED